MKNKEIAEEVLKLRRTLGLTQEELARDLGVTISSVYCWEKGLSFSSLLALRAIAQLRARLSADASQDDGETKED